MLERLLRLKKYITKAFQKIQIDQLIKVKTTNLDDEEWEQLKLLV
jgi:hypothetical protein